MKTIEEKLGTVKTKKDSQSHIEIDQIICKDCGHKRCIKVCPANTYEELDGEIKIAYENCLECGSCRVICKKGAISWQNPRGGFGVKFFNG